MAKNLNLAEILGLGASGAYDGTFTLSGDSAALCLSWLSLLTYGNWEGVGEELSQAEKDTIDEMLSSCLYELMEETEVSDGVPLGTIIFSAYESNPSGYLPCDGQAYAKSVAPELYAILDDAFIIDANNFIVPDLRGRAAIGFGYAPHVKETVMGEKAGQDTVILTVDEIPSHRHGISHKNNANGIWGWRILWDTIQTPNIHYTEYEGGGEGHENYMPFQALRALIKAINT